MNKEELLERLDYSYAYINDLNKIMSDNKKEKKYYYTVVNRENISHIHHYEVVNNAKVVYEDKNIIVEYGGGLETFISYKNGKKP